MGNRFGSSYGGGSPLRDLAQRNFMNRARSALLARVEGGGGGGDYTPGPTAGRFGMISGRQPTAQESVAFNQMNAIREQGKATALSELAKQRMTPKERADLINKQRELDIKAAEAGLDPTFGRAADEKGAGTPASGRKLGGERIGGKRKEERGKRKGGGSITIPPKKPGVYRDPKVAAPGTYRVRGEYGIQRPEAGGQEPAVGSGASLADIAAGMDPGMWAGYDAGLPAPAAPGAISPTGGGGESVPGLADTVRQVITDMFYRAPARAVGEGNLSAAGNTLADIVWRAPVNELSRGGREIGRGANWLSRQVLGGVR